MGGVGLSPASFRGFRHPNRLVLYGDSRPQQTYLDGQNLRRSNSNHRGWGNALAGQRAVFCGNYGVSGDRSDQALARLGAALATGCGVIDIQLGVNDTGQSVSAGFVAVAGPYVGQTITTANVALFAFTNIMIAVNAANKLGVTPLVTLEAGSTTINTVALCAALNELNERLREQAETTRMVLYDLPALIQNPTSAVSQIGFLANNMRDSTHEGLLGAYNGGNGNAFAAGYAAILTAIMPAFPREQRNIIENPTNSLVNLIANPLFNTASGGAVNTGVTGTAPSGATVRRGAGTATATCSVSAPADGSPGNETVLAITFNSAGDAVRIQYDITSANWTFGDLLQGSCEVVVDAGSVNLCGVYLFVQGEVDGATLVTASDLEPIDTTKAGPTTALKLSLMTEKFVIPAGAAKTFLTFQMTAVGAGAGSATVRFRRPSLRKRFA